MRQLFWFFVLIITHTQLTLAQPLVLSGNVNFSSHVVSFSSACNCATVGNAQGFAPNNRVVVIQMQGAEVSRQNSTAFGSVTSYGSAGLFEFNTVASVVGNTVTLRNKPTVQFDYSNGSVQLVKMPSAKVVSVQGNLTAAAWNGKSGGVVAIEASELVMISGAIDVSGKGFRGGASQAGIDNCEATALYYSSSSQFAGAKGEGIAVVDTAFARGRGAWANGGGAGNAAQAGGAGGANASNGGNGGYSSTSCVQSSNKNGIGAFGLNYSSVETRVFMGGGAGAGHQLTNNQVNGGNGGGIVIISTPKIVSANGWIVAKGNNGDNANGGGACGGGAGGSVYMGSSLIENKLTIDVSGGNGGNADANVATGGGGSAGVVAIPTMDIPENVTITNSVGVAGTSTTQQNASNGLRGIVVSGMQLPTPGVEVALLTIEAGNTQQTCKNQAVQLGVSIKSSKKINSITWTPSENVARATTANPTVAPTSTTTYTVTVVTEDGCVAVDSVKVEVTGNLEVNVADHVQTCSQQSVALAATVKKPTGLETFEWSPKVGLSDASVSNPVATPSQTTVYTVVVRNNVGCVVTKQCTVEVKSSEQPNVVGRSAVCVNSTETYMVQGVSSSEFTWAVKGATALQIAPNKTSATVTFGTDADSWIAITGYGNSCIATTKFNVTVETPAAVTINTTKTELADGESTVLDAGSFASYHWSTGETTRTITVNKAGAYSVEVKTNAGCSVLSNEIVISTKASVIASQTQICEGSTTTLRAAIDAEHIQWNTGETTNEITVSKKGTYFYTAQLHSGNEVTSQAITINVVNNPKPVIQVAKRGLVASVATQWQWFKNGVEIPCTSMVLQTSEYGKYKVRTVSEFGCVNVSDDVEYPSQFVASAQVTNVAGFIGSNVATTLTIQSQAKRSVRYTATLVVNADALLPIGKTPEGTVISGGRVIEVQGSTNEQGDATTLLEFTVLPTELLQTAIEIVNVKFDDANVQAEEILAGEVTIQSTCGSRTNKGINTSFELAIKQNYPNPFADRTTIEYTLLENTFTELFVVNQQGIEVATILRANAERGSYKTAFNASELSSGIYTVVLQTPNARKTMQMSIVK